MSPYICTLLFVFELIHVPRHSVFLKDVVLQLNIVFMLFTLPTFHLYRFWVKDLASENIAFILAAGDTSHSPYGPVEQSPTA